MPTPRGLSQAPTSFIGSWYQDIHRLPLVACHKTNIQKAKLRYKEMLASTIQFSKYGQEHQPLTTTRQMSIQPRETKHPVQNTHTNSLVRAGPSHPPHQHNTGVTVTPEETVQPDHSGRPDSSGPNSAPRRSTRPLHVPRPQVSSTSFSDSASTPNGQCSTFRSTIAQEHSPWKR